MGNLLLMLLFTAVLSLILGMGLPTTANYIVVSSLLAPVIVTLGQQSGLIVPLIAVHLFVFYFGIMADVTPPVGLASFAAAAISGGDPIRTGFVAFFYSLRTAMLPFLFIFNTDLLLIDVGWFEGIIVLINTPGEDSANGGDILSIRNPGRNSMKAISNNANVSQIRLRVSNHPCVAAANSNIAVVATMNTIMPSNQPTSINKRSVLKINRNGNIAVRRL